MNRLATNLRNPRLLAALGVSAIIVTAAAVGTSATAGGGVDLVPDLAQAAPRDIVIAKRKERVRVRGKLKKGNVVRVAFTSEVYNVGNGPFIVNGARKSTKVTNMTASQVINSTDGSSRTVSNTGVWYYATNSDHEHWHYKKFDVFTLKNHSGKLVANSSKQGFCLGDRGKGLQSLPNAVAQPVYVEHCGLKKRRLLSINGGISVGWGDDYNAFLEGQSINVTKVPAGTYCLEHRATSEFEELTRDNNVAVALLAIDPKASPPTMTVVGTLSAEDGTVAPSCALAYSNAGV